MSSSSLRALGPGSVLGALRADLRRTTRDLLIVGPWVDDFFAEAVVASTPDAVRVRLLTRPREEMGDTFRPHANAAAERLRARRGGQVRTLGNLHAKVIVLDEEVVYCGSANWYRYSLEHAAEIVVAGPVACVPGILDEVASLWDQAADDVMTTARRPSPPNPSGYAQEALDPIAAAAMASVRGAFVLGKRRKK